MKLKLKPCYSLSITIVVIIIIMNNSNYSCMVDFKKQEMIGSR